MKETYIVYNPLFGACYAIEVDGTKMRLYSQDVVGHVADETTEFSSAAEAKEIAEMCFKMNKAELNSDVEN